MLPALDLQNLNLVLIGVGMVSVVIFYVLKKIVSSIVKVIFFTVVFALVAFAAMYFGFLK